MSAQETQLPEQLKAKWLQQLNHKAVELLARREYSLEEMRQKLGQSLQKQHTYSRKNHSNARQNQSIPSWASKDQSGFIEPSQLSLADYQFEIDEMIQSILDALVAKGWQSDLRWATSLVRSKINSGYGPQKIRFLLQQKGGSEALFRQACEDLAVDWQAQLFVAIEKRLSKEGHFSLQDLDSEEAQAMAAEGIDQPVCWQTQLAAKKSAHQRQAKQVRYFVSRGFHLADVVAALKEFQSE